MTSSPSLRVAALSALAALAACSGGGSSAPVAPIVGGAPLAAAAVFRLGFHVAPVMAIFSTARAPRGVRAPQYVSPATRSVAAYDGGTLIYVGNLTTSPPTISTVFDLGGPTTVTDGSCTATAGGTDCVFTVSTTAGAHTFDVVTYPVPQGQTTEAARRAPADTGTAPATFHGVILAEGQLAVTLASGDNPDQTIVPLGVADTVLFLAEQTPSGVVGTPTTLPYWIGDASGNQIIQPGDYDNGPVTIAESDGNAILTLSPTSQTTPPATYGFQTLSVTCAKQGTATITATAKNKPDTAYASGLTYSSANYASGTLGSIEFECQPSSATLPITVNSITKGRQ